MLEVADKTILGINVKIYDLAVERRIGKIDSYIRITLNNLRAVLAIGIQNVSGIRCSVLKEVRPSLLGVFNLTRRTNSVNKSVYI